MSFLRSFAALVAISLVAGGGNSQSQFTGPTSFLQHPDPNLFDQFGYSVALSGNEIVIGAHGDDQAGPDSGAVFLFARSSADGPWDLSHTFRMPGASRFGTSVALEGNVLAVGSAGTVYLFERNWGGFDRWGFVADRPGSSAALGRTVAIDGLRVLAGNRVYERDLGGPANWGLRATLLAEDSPPGPFGYSVGLDGDLAVIGAPRFDGPSGTAYVFGRNQGGTDAWGQVKKLEPAASMNSLGFVVAIGDDIVAISDSATTPPLLFRKDAGGLDQWGQSAVVSDPNLPGRGFITLDVDRGRLVGIANGANAAVIYDQDELDPDQWTFTDRVAPSGAAIGTGVDVSSDLLVVSSFGDQTNGQEAGAAFVVDASSRFEILDVNSDPALVSTVGVTQNAEKLALADVPRTGAVTDGVTRLLLRYTAPEAGHVTFRMDGHPPDDGGVDTIDGDNRLLEIQVPTVMTSQGEMAFALYRAPDEFTIDTHRLNREIEIQSWFTPTGAPPTAVRTLTLDLYRPPVVFVHGFWSEPERWRTLPLFNDSRFLQHAADYEDTNDYPFETNNSVVQDIITTARADARARGIAITQVDVVAHSMGGLLARIWSTHPDYGDAESLGQGSIRKLVTLDTPHWGSPLAEALDSAGSIELAIVAAVLKTSIDNGAMNDLKPGSTALASMGASQVPTHALVGRGGSDILVNAGVRLGKLFGAFDLLFGGLTGSNLYGGEAHDYVVAESSQQGGLPDAARTTFSGDDGQHFNNLSSTHYSIAAEFQLRTPITDVSFSELPTPPPPELVGSERSIKVEQKTSFGPQSLVITTPLPGASVSPGDEIVVTVVPASGVVVDSVTVVGPEIEWVGPDHEAPFEFLVAIEETASVSTDIVAIGSGPDGNAVSDITSLDVVQTAALQSLRIVPGSVLLTCGTTEWVQLTVLGLYSDGVERDVTEAAQTTYSVLDSNVAIADSGGRVSMRALGATLLETSHEAVSVTTQVQALDVGSCGMFADGFESGDTTRWSASSR